MTAAPLLVLATFASFLLGLAVFRRRRTGARLTEYVYWLVGPAERALAAGGISPDALTLAGLLLSIAAGAFAAGGLFAAAGIVYVSGGVLDILDGRVARRSGRSTRAGALLDSVCDRWGEFVVLGGIAHAVRGEGVALAGVLLCTAGSQMVSYTRARAEALGVSLAVGLMQRSERIVTVGLGLVIAGAVAGWGPNASRIVLTMTVYGVGVMSTVTAVHRLFAGSGALTAPRDHGVGS